MSPSSPATRARSAIAEVSVIVPARNEEASLGACLESLTSQTGVEFEIIVVDDASADRTGEIAGGFAGVRLISAGSMPIGAAGKSWTGKNNAIVAGVRVARAPWLLFTDADTIHKPESLAHALDEAKREHADLLSYSPEQVVVTFAERAVMPVVFAELAAKYPLHKVREQNSEVVAANGQYILVRRPAYDAMGGHAAVATEVLEDVALAKLFRQAGYRVFFRYGADALGTRMYRNWAQLREGWTKNLALLFPQAGCLACQNCFWWFAAWASLTVAVEGAARRHSWWIVFTVVWLLLFRRIRAAHFSFANSLVAMLFGPPVFTYLLLRSTKAYKSGQVSWKGRDYDISGAAEKPPANVQSAKPVLNAESQRLST